MADDPSDKQSPQRHDEEGFGGSMPNPEIVEDEDTLDEAHEMGLYKNADEEHPAELNIGEQFSAAEENHTKND